MTNQALGMPRRTGFPVLPDPDGDERMFRLRIIAAVKELFLRAEDFDNRLAAAERELGIRS